MLDVSLDGVSFSYGNAGFALRDVSVRFPRSTHTAVIGPPGAGASTLLKLLAGELRPAAGEIMIGARRVNDLRRARRPLLYVTSEPSVPTRWTVQHALVAALRQRNLDREDRHREYVLAVGKWSLGPIADRRIRSLSATEATIVEIARVEILRPAVLVADRMLAGLNPAVAARVADEFYRSMRIIGTNVISAPASHAEVGFANSAVILDAGRVVQHGVPARLFAEPRTEAAAVATGEVNVVPVSVKAGVVSSAIGTWDDAEAGFEGNGVALIRPTDFAIAARGEESDLIFSIEEAAFRDGRWIARGLVSGGTVLHVALAPSSEVHKGKLLPLRLTATRIPLIAREIAPEFRSVRDSLIPSMRESR